MGIIYGLGTRQHRLNEIWPNTLKHTKSVGINILMRNQRGVIIAGIQRGITKR